MSDLNPLYSVLPTRQVENLGHELNSEDVATLSYLVQQGMGANTLRALAADLAYIECWCKAATGHDLDWPASETLILKFIAHHLYDVAKHEVDKSHGMPEEVVSAMIKAGVLKHVGPHAPSTVKRRLSSWATLTRWKGLEGAFQSPKIKNAIRLAVRASERPRQRKSKKAITIDVLTKLIATCGQSLVDIRDKAILLVAFASGGRRRSEIASLRMSQLTREADVLIDARDAGKGTMPCARIRLGRTKTTTNDEDDYALIMGRPVVALYQWIEAAHIDKGAIFRSIDRWGNINNVALTGQSINNMIKSRVKKAGLDPNDFSAHALRAGYLTEAARKGISLPEAMQQSGHKSIQQAARYYNDSERRSGLAARLID